MDEQDHTIELRFNEDNFCHLLGIESILRKHVKKQDLPFYKGIKGWNRIQNEELDFTFLKQRNKKGFQDNKSRFVFFYLIPKLLESPKAVRYDPVRVKSMVDCEIIFYDVLQKAYVHIGVEKIEEVGYYVPKTFLIEKITLESDGDKYVENQQPISVEKVTKLSLEG